MTSSPAIGPDTKPMVLFDSWIREAQASKLIREPTAMCVSTLSRDEDLHSRMVLCKQWSDDGFTFFTNYQSRKGLDLQHQATAAATFYWDPLSRQVNITGPVTKTSREISEKYWTSRPHDSQVSQLISKQSQPLPSRQQMEQEWNAADLEFRGKQIPCPEHWGGYLISPKRIEFWVGQPGRLHDRYVFEKTQGHWTFRRLYP